MFESYDILIRIGRRTEAGRGNQITLRLPDGREAQGWLSLLGPEVTSEVRELARQALTEAGQTRVRLLVEILSTWLYSYSWESFLPPLLFEEPSQVELIRISPQADPHSLIPVSLPLDVIVASAGEIEPDFRSEVDQALRYFRTTVAEGVTQSYLRSLLRGREFDIVHIIAEGEWHSSEDSGRTECTVLGLEARRLRVLLARSGARLLILQSLTGDLGPLLNLAHFLFSRGGPTVLVAGPETNAPRGSFLADIYFGIVHDEQLDVTFDRARRTRNTQASLFCARGGEDVLRISTLLPRLQAEAETKLARADAARTTIDALLLPTAEPHEVEIRGFDLRDLGERSTTLAFAAGEIEKLRDWSPNYLREKGGMVPMRQGFDDLRRFEALLEKAEAVTRRVVNTWFTSGNRSLSPEESLAAGAEYDLNIQIGPPLRQSNVRRPAEIPEEELSPFYTDEGIDLRIVLFSEDFQIPGPEQLLRLPEPPLASPTVNFHVRAPAESGQARLRACVYYQQNLLQSLLVDAAVTPEAQAPHPAGNHAEVEFALSGTLRQIQRLPERTLNILTNDSGDGTHTFAVAGKGLRQSFRLDEGKMRTAVDVARQQLDKVGTTTDWLGRPAYRFGPNHRGEPQEFVSQIKELAALGYELYVELVTDQDVAFEEDLRQALGCSATIQVAMTRSANYVFPWALVYDKPLVRSDGNVVCPETLKALAKGGVEGFLDSHPCFAAGCPHADDNNVICPSGFWGFKHVIEQPLPVPAEGATGEAGEIELEIKAAGKIAMLMAVSRDLQMLNEHKAEVINLPHLAIDYRDDKMGIGKALQRTDLQIVYFFCHGGRKGASVWLGVGKGEKLYPTDLHGWKVNWGTCHPLVILNGCQTVGITPDDLLDFNRRLARSRAAGIIGTEVSIHESLARHFAIGLFAGLIRGARMGEIMRSHRLQLLERYNPLGLVYTLYCHAGLRVIAQ